MLANAQTCSPSTVTRYQKRISGPLLDREDVFVEVPPVEYEKLIEDQQGEDSSQPRLRVEEARNIQRERFKESGLFCNSEMGPAKVWKFCQMDDGAKGLLQTATQRLNLSGRASTASSKCPAPSGTRKVRMASTSPTWPRPYSTDPGLRLAEH